MITTLSFLSRDSSSESDILMPLLVIIILTLMMYYSLILLFFFFFYDYSMMTGMMSMLCSYIRCSISYSRVDRVVVSKQHYRSNIPSIIIIFILLAVVVVVVVVGSCSSLLVVCKPTRHRHRHQLCESSRTKSAMWLLARSFARRHDNDQVDRRRHRALAAL